MSDMSTSTARDTISYGFHIRPKNYCRVIQSQLQEELLLSPGVDYYLPWDREGITVIEEKLPNVTGRYENVPPLAVEDTELLNWLKLSESAFKFWDNEKDDIWNNL